jgi:hypothetical protein
VAAGWVNGLIVLPETAQEVRRVTNGVGYNRQELHAAFRELPNGFNLLIEPRLLMGYV